MIKVRVGQVWEKIETDSRVSRYEKSDRITVKYSNDLIVKYGLHCELKINRFTEEFKFIPQNDLEELAVKMDKWPVTANEALNYLRNSEFYWRGDFIFKQGCKSIFKKQWQSMRYHLGKDKKPHYRLTGGEWVKV